MRRRTMCGSGLLLAALVAGACAGKAAVPSPAPPAPVKAAPVATPAAAPDAAAALAGHWLWNVQVGGEGYTGTMDLSRRPDGTWQAKVVDSSAGDLVVTSFKVEGATATMVVESPGGPAQLVATLKPDGTMEGTLVMNAGDGTFSARKG